MKRSVVREFLKYTSVPGMISFAGGLPAPELFPVDGIAEAARYALSESPRSALQYGQTEGLFSLREWIARKFGVPIEEVLITSGAQQALDLIGRVLLDPGDKVLVENPTYLALLSAWRPAGVNFLPVEMDQAGLDPASVERLLVHRPKLLYTIPTYQNPAGTTLSRQRRQALIELLHEQELIVVEDDPYRELRFEGEELPTLHSLARGNGAGTVLHVGTFSKIIAPGLRVGWIVAAAPLMEKLVQAKQALDLHTSTLNQYLVLRLLQQGLLDRHLPKLRVAYQSRRDRMLNELARAFPSEATWTHPSGGMFLMVTLPQAIDAASFAQEALRCHVAVIPGQEFFLEGMGQNALRVNFSNATLDEIEIGIRRLAELLRKRLNDG